MICQLHVFQWLHSPLCSLRSRLFLSAWYRKTKNFREPTQINRKESATLPLLSWFGSCFPLGCSFWWSDKRDSIQWNLKNIIFALDLNSTQSSWRHKVLMNSSFYSVNPYISDIFVTQSAPLCSLFCVSFVTFCDRRCVYSLFKKRLSAGSCRIFIRKMAARKRQFHSRTHAIQVSFSFSYLLNLFFQALKGVDVTGKTYAITGTTSGIGIETARVLVLKGAHIVMINRNVAESEKLKAKILKEKPDGKIDIVVCDLNSLSSVQRAAEEYLSKDW